VAFHLGAEVGADLVLEVLRKERQDIGARSRSGRCIAGYSEKWPDLGSHRKPRTM
jgi:hypothetical protein